MQIGAGWNPHWHQPTDLYATYSDKDFLLGLNAAQTTLAAVAQLVGRQGQALTPGQPFTHARIARGDARDRRCKCSP